MMHLNDKQNAKSLPFVLANSKPYALEQYEDDALGYYDPITQTWRGTLLFHKSSTSRNVSSTSAATCSQLRDRPHCAIASRSQCACNASRNAFSSASTFPGGTIFP